MRAHGLLLKITKLIIQLFSTYSACCYITLLFPESREFVLSKTEILENQVKTEKNCKEPNFEEFVLAAFVDCCQISCT